MQTYKQWRSEQRDFGDHGMSDRMDWIVTPAFQHRDSDFLSQSNFNIILEMLGGEQEDKVEIHRFNHWAVGWTELILIAPLPELITIAEDIEKRLENHPVLDEEDWSERQYEGANQIWKHLTIKDRLEEIERFNNYNISYPICFLQSRFDYLPSGFEYDHWNL
jgi:hypothetical protein